jgi:hypothetical protein
MVKRLRKQFVLVYLAITVWLVSYDVALWMSIKKPYDSTWLNARYGRKEQVKLKLVTSESFGYLSNWSTGEFLKSLKSEKINKSLCDL